MRCRNWKLKPLTRGCKNGGSYRSRHCSGFTLLEVIIALGVVAVGILAVSRAVTGYVETTTTLEQRMVANWVASNRLATLRIQKITPLPGTSRGVEEMAGRAWYFSETITATADPYLFRVDIVVYADSAETDEVGSLHGYLLNEEALTLTQSNLRVIIISEKPAATVWSGNITGENLFEPAMVEIASSQAPRDRRKCPWCNDGSSFSLPFLRNDSSSFSLAFLHNDGSSFLRTFLHDDGLLVSSNEA